MLYRWGARVGSGGGDPWGGWGATESAMGSEIVRESRRPISAGISMGDMVAESSGGASCGTSALGAVVANAMDRGMADASAWCSVERWKSGGGKLELDVDDSLSFVASRVKNGGGIELELEVESSSYCVARTIRRGIESESISSLEVISEDAELDDELWSSSHVNSWGGYARGNG